ncbi:pentapeptide repeat-containing protein [Saccharopolyspora taberi]|uniref:Pentapeptide repeat-containing protein n=1 Tax=Saccharopolyspora taberi TaxID=60895 RepID=A0ABN3VM84_9PSEU
MRDRRLPLTIFAAVLVLVGASTALLVFDPRVTSADALRTGGLAAGSVVALYALWLNDRRRKVDEERQRLEHRRQELDSERYALEQRRQELEHRRTDHERDRSADERFARAVELLGHDADQVRVGALHALAGLARSSPDYTQTVLDVLCSYLRRPFVHPKWTDDDTGVTSELELERYVRQTAQRLITELLPSAADPGAQPYDLDLTNAWLERFSLSGRLVGRVAAFACRFRHTTNLNGAVFRGPVALRDSTFLGRVRAVASTFEDRLELRGIRTFERFDFDRADFRGPVDVKRVELTSPAYFRDSAFHGGVDLRHARITGELHFTPVGGAPEALLDDTRVAEAHCLPAEWAVQNGLLIHNHPHG